MAEESMTPPRRVKITLSNSIPLAARKFKRLACPALIIQNDTGNKHSPATIVAAITSSQDFHPCPILRLSEWDDRPQ